MKPKFTMILALMASSAIGGDEQQTRVFWDVN